jgi:thioredoxin 2
MSTYQVTCTSCGSANRIPAEKEGLAGRCGNCHAQLPPLYLSPQQMSDGSFDNFVAHYKGPIIAEFWAPW